MGHVPSQRLTKPRTNTNSVCLGRPDTSSSRNNDHLEDSRLSFSNDSPLSFTGSASFDHFESPSASTTNLTNPGVRPRDRSSASRDSSKRRSVAVDHSDVDVAAAIALLQELKKRASPEDLILLHKALLPARNVERAISPAKADSRDNDEILSPLIRRSSLLPAGVKTRLSRELLRNFSENNVATRSASVSREKAPVAIPTLDMPLNFEALDLAGGASDSQGTRPVTPSDFFPQIGTYKMGSLRITNGAASPEPGRLLSRMEKTGSENSTFPAPESVSGDGFVTADEGESSPECVRPTRATLVDLRAPRRSSEERRTRQPDVRARSKSRGPPRCGSEDQRTRPVPQQTEPPNVQQRAAEYAQDYAAECESLENPHMPTPALTTTVSRLSTVHDESPVEEGANGREEALRKLTGETPSDRGQDSRDQKTLGVPRPPMHAKSDSGYSSEASRRSIVKESNVEEFLLAALDAAEQAERSKLKVSPNPASGRPSLERIREDKVSNSRSPYVQQISTSQKTERHRSLPSFFSRKSSSSTSVNTISTTTAPPAKHTKRLQKSRPQSQVVVQQVVTEPQPPLKPEPETVPSVPEDLSVNFSRPTRRVDRSSASPQPKPVEDDNDSRGRGRSRKQDAKSQPVGKETSPVETTSRRSMSIFRFRSRSRSKSQHRQEDDITVLSITDEPLPSNTFNDFGTVAQSLGQSPYDIATRRVKQMGAYDPSKPWFHPHEISRAAPAPKVDASSTTQKSRGKSLDRDQQDRARSQSRPRESIETSRTSSRPPTRGKSRRSHSVHNIAVPRVPEPVPELPKQEALAGTFTRPVSKDGTVRVGTIDLGNGFAQGRLEPILTKTEKAKTRRRTQSVSPRVHRETTKAVKLEEPMPQTPTPQAPPREQPEVPTHDLPKDLSEAPPKVPAHGKQPATLPSASSVPTASAHVKTPTSAPQSPASPNFPAMHPVWESQALAWRERKQSIGEMLSSPTGEKKSFMSPKLPNSPVIQAYSPTLQAPRRAPTVVVSRYITPQGSEFAMHLDEEDPYKKLHTENPADLRPAQLDVDRTDSSSTYRTATSERSQDSFASSDSAKYRAYRTDELAQSPKIPNPAAPKSNTTQKRVSRGFEQPKRRSTAPAEGPAVAFDRFSGGLAYGWERGIGFGGSAGTRQKNDNKAARKSVAISQNFGVDLSDVPVFMVKQ